MGSKVQKLAGKWKVMNMAVVAESEGSRSVEEGGLYLVEQRLKTFEGAGWPYDSGSCTVQKVAEAGFYYCGTLQAPDWVRCVVCHSDVDGWEASDDPLKEHKKLSPKCAFLKLRDPYSITVRDYFDMEEAAMQNYIAMETVKLEQDIKTFNAGIREQLVQSIEQQQSETGMQ